MPESIQSTDSAPEGASPTPSDSPPEATAAPFQVDLLAQAQAESQRLKDSWMRAVADLDNYRKRARREVDDAHRSGREDLLRTLLPVFDNLERAMHSAQRASDVKAVAEGLAMVLRQFGEALGRVGIQKVTTVGEVFDPTVHEAIQQIETADHPAGTVVAEVQPGYAQGDRLVRAAMVIVARPPVAAPSDKNGS